MIRRPVAEAVPLQEATSSDADDTSPAEAPSHTSKGLISAHCSALPPAVL